MNWLDKNWWNYGFNKLLIVRNTLILFFGFCIINCFFIQRLSSNLYINDNIQKHIWSNKKYNFVIRYVRNFPSTIFYTSQIFFGIRFQYEKLEYENRLWGWGILGLIYFFIMYIIGLFCVANLVNYIVTI